MTSSLKWHKLPVAFRAADVMNLLGLTNEQTTKSLYRWLRDGHISRLGKRLDVYINNVKCEHDELKVPLMLSYLHPMATYCGPSILNNYEWSTQYTPLTYCLLPRLTKDIVIPESSVVLLRRPHRWWKAALPFITTEKGTAAFPSRHLKPEALLAEALLTTVVHGDIRDLWSPDVDDLYFDEIDRTVTDEQWYSAFTAIANFYRKTLPPPAGSKQDWYEQLKHMLPLHDVGASCSDVPAF